MRTFVRAGAALLASATLWLTACSDAVAPRDTATRRTPAARPSTIISDAPRGGRAGFYFLSPLVPSPPSFAGTFDPNVQATARICTGSVVCLSPLATLSMGRGLTVDALRQAYVGTWAVPTNLTLGTGTYSLEVLAAGTRLGRADLFVAPDPLTARNAPPGYVGVTRGATLLIRFRIETGMVGAITVTPAEASVSVGGTQGFIATATDLHGMPLPSATFAWNALNANVASLSAVSGASVTATGLAAGNTPIVVSSNGVSAAAQLSVTAPTRPPSAASDNFSATGGVPFTLPAPGILTNDDLGAPAAVVESFGGGSLGGTVTSRPAGTTATLAGGGSLRINANGSLEFTAPNGFAGAFVVQYRLANSNGASDGTIIINVQRAPIAVNDTRSFLAGGTLNEAAPGILANDDRGVPQGDVLAFGGNTLGGTAFSNSAGSTVSDGAGGLIRINADGSVVHQPAPGFAGTVSVQYVVGNNAGTSIGTLTINVQRAPQAVDDAYNAAVNGTLVLPAAVGVLTNDQLGVPAASVVSFGGGTVGGTVTSTPAGGTITFGGGGSLSISANGALNFTRAPSFAGTFVVRYRIQNAAGMSDATISIFVPFPP